MPKPPPKRDSTGPKLWIGIDPGKQGGLVTIDDVGQVWHSVIPPSTLDLLNLFRSFEGMPGARAALEIVRTRPGEGHVGAFTFGEGYGMLQMALTACKIPYEKVASQTWQKTFSVKTRQTKKGESYAQFKERLRQVAQREFPQLEIWSTPRTIGYQRSICDALLMAEHLRRKHELKPTR